MRGRAPGAGRLWLAVAALLTAAPAAGSEILRVGSKRFTESTILGEILTQAERYVSYPGAWWLTIFPGLAIFVTVASYNLVGEGLRDALDPQLRE